MASTRALLRHVLDNDEEVRRWAADWFGFTTKKAESADLTTYDGYVAVILEEGVRRGVLTAEQLRGQQPL